MAHATTTLFDYSSLILMAISIIPFFNTISNEPINTLICVFCQIFARFFYGKFKFLCHRVCIYLKFGIYVNFFFFPFRLLHQMGSLPIECTFLCPAFTHQYCILSNILIFAHLKYEECHYHFNFHFFDYEKMFHTFI